ncbi:MAG: fibronectin type III domain-containing protein, partial [Dehalococcoidia bacterium]
QRSGDDGQTWRDIAELEQAATSFVDDDGLEDEVTYLYRIRAFDPDGVSGHSNTASATATDLPRPE